MKIFVKSLVLCFASAALVGCSAADKSCMAANSWAQPVWKCGGASMPQVEAPDLEAEPEPEPAKVRRSGDKIEILEKVLFETGSANIDPASYGLLDEVARVLNENDDIAKVRVEGHTDNTGGAQLNKRLSQKRAESVRSYLIDKGIADDRLTAKGYGPSKPIADNDTDEGRENNRRVEFTILEE